MQRTITAEAEQIDGDRYLGIAQKCFDSLFDLNKIDKLARTNKNGEATILPNDVMAKSGDITLWRVNNSQIKEWWRRSGKDNQGIDKYEKQQIESNPYANVVIDNRPGKCLMAIEKSAAWESKPDLLRDMVLNNFNRLLSERYDLEMRIEAQMNPTDIWDFVRERIHEHQDYPRKVTFSFQNPDKINKSNSLDIKSEHLKSIVQTVVLADALEGDFSMKFDQLSATKVSQQNKDLAEMVNLCGENGYTISISFKDFKTYRINDYVKAYFPMNHEVLEQFGTGQRTIDGKSLLEAWFDEVAEQTKNYKNESEIPKRRNKFRS